jgi:hypothetical protein
MSSSIGILRVHAKNCKLLQNPSPIKSFFLLTELCVFKVKNNMRKNIVIYSQRYDTGWHFGAMGGNEFHFKYKLTCFLKIRPWS